MQTMSQESETSQPIMNNNINNFNQENDIDRSNLSINIHDYSSCAQVLDLDIHGQNFDPCQNPDRGLLNEEIKVPAKQCDDADIRKILQKIDPNNTQDIENISNGFNPLTNDASNFSNHEISNAKRTKLSPNETLQNPKADYINQRNISKMIQAPSEYPSVDISKIFEIKKSNVNSVVNVFISEYRKSKKGNPDFQKFCCLCQLKDYESNLGELFGPYVIYENSKPLEIKSVYFHGECILHCKDVHLVGKNLIGLNLAWKTASEAVLYKI
ncbi:MAG: hypothetical protein MHPSP_000047 [Paramarteilia canceri]